MMEEKSSIISYNSRGFNKCKQDFLRNILSEVGGHTFLFNQENFLLKKNGYIAEQALPEHRIVFKPAVKDSLEGRPKGGMFIAVPICFKDCITEVAVDSNRIQCVLARVAQCKLLLINSYFPTDPRGEFDENDLVIILNEIQKLIDENDFHHLIIGGDINADFGRKTRFVDMIREFIESTGMCKSWDGFPVKFTHVTEKEGITYTSTIDHFMWNASFDVLVDDAGVINSPENMSDHCPIFCHFCLPAPKGESKESKSKPKIPSWSHAKEENRAVFYEELTKKLERISIPCHATQCKDVHCDKSDHREELDNFMAEILGVVEQTAEETLSNHGNHNKKQKRRLPDWKDEVDPVKDTAQFWHAVWKSAGSPMNCNLHGIMKRTRNAYHLIIRKKKRLLDRLKREDLLQNCLDNDGSIFEAIKRQRRCKQTCASTIDGHTEDIPDYLATKYERLYNSVDDKENLIRLEGDIENLIDDKSLTFVNLISTDVVKLVTREKLKPGKTDPNSKITSDFLIHGPDILFELIATCFRSYIIHAHVSSFLLISTLVPLIKDKLGDLTSSNNYRSIAISSLILKIFDLVILSALSEHLCLDDLQFSYQEEVSTSMCTWLALETISHFLRNGNDVYTCLMDMSKAFDTVQHSHLFRKLLEQGLPAIIIRYILVSYKHQKANVRWDGQESRFFPISNGVKQGAILSAILYCVYTNGIFQELRRSKVGCFIGRNYVGVLGYADDLYLLAPSIDALQEMLKMCECYAADHNLKFSTDPNPNKSKTKCMAYQRKERELPNLKLCGNSLPWVKHGKHLGTRLEVDKDILAKDVVEKRARYIQCNNELTQEFAYASSYTKAWINRVFNSHAYGATLWNLYGREANMFYNTWSTSIRKMYRVDRRTHRYLIEPLSEMEHIKRSILKRYLGFTEKLSTSRKTVVKNVFRVIGSDCRSSTGSNRRNLLLECGGDSILLTKKDVERTKFQEIPPGEEWRVSIINELVEIRDGSLAPIHWNRNEIDEMLTYLCTT